jgi:hypothetical protein
VEPDYATICSDHTVLEFMVFPFQRGFATVVAAPLHIIRVCVGTPEIRLIYPLLHRIAEDTFRVGAYKREAESQRVGFPYNAVY